MSNSLDPDQARRLVWPDLDLNCLQRLSADDTGRKITVNVLKLRTLKNNYFFRCS